MLKKAKAKRTAKKAGRPYPNMVDNIRAMKKKKEKVMPGYHKGKSAKAKEIVAKDPRLKRAGVTGYNKPKRTPDHPTKSHIVVAKEGNKIKTIQFGQQGVKGDKTMTPRAKSFKVETKEVY